MKNFFTGMLTALLLVLVVYLNLPQPTPQVEIQLLPYEVEVERETFSEENLIKYLNELRIPHPHVVLAQAKLETGNFTSTIFLENNNLFGMKRSYYRPSTAVGMNRRHARYKHWKDSVLDFALYKAYVAQNKTLDEYLTLLQRSYAEDPNYVRKVNRIALENQHHFIL